jgi:hypothetical protein
MTMFEGRGEESGMADDFPMEDIQETPRTSSTTRKGGHWICSEYFSAKL